MKNPLFHRAAALMMLALAATCSAIPAMAQARPTLVQDNDQAARAPFQAVVNLNSGNGINIVNVPIPSGKRLVIDYVSVTGADLSVNGAIQPIILLESSVAGYPSVNYYLPLVESPLVPTQYYYEGSPKVYSDTLYVGFGYSGYAPTSPGYAIQSVNISGHLINIS